jgi:hypothetical protein
MILVRTDHPCLRVGRHTRTLWPCFTSRAQQPPPCPRLCTLPPRYHCAHSCAHHHHAPPHLQPLQPLANPSGSRSKDAAPVEGGCHSAPVCPPVHTPPVLLSSSCHRPCSSSSTGAARPPALANLHATDLLHRPACMPVGPHPVSPSPTSMDCVCMKFET